MHFIFRRSDRVHLYTAQDRPNALAAKWRTCLANEGGTEDDYVCLQRDGRVPSGMMPSCSADGVLSFEKSLATLRHEARAVDRESALAKLQGLGLTESEALALGDSSHG